MFLVPLLGALACVLSPGGVRAQDLPDGGNLIDPGAVRAREWLKAGNGKTDGSEWRGDVEFGYIGTTGSSNTVSTHSRLRVQNDRPRWIHTFRYEILYVEEEHVTTTDQTRASQKSAYKLTPDDYLFETVRYLRNPSLGYRYRVSEVVGYGRRLVGTETLRLYLEAGPGARQTRQPDQSVDSEAQAYLSSELDWDFAKKANFNLQLVTEAAKSDTMTEIHAALSARINARFSLKVSHSIVTHSEPVGDAPPTDTITSATLVYTF